MTWRMSLFVRGGGGQEEGEGWVTGGTETSAQREGMLLRVLKQPHSDT